MVIGKVLSGRYRLDERCAAGGMGTVYVATDERLGRKVAVKLLKEELVDDERFVERFRREARSAAALSHPNVANVYDYGSDGPHHYIVMELIEGDDLGRVLRSEGPLSPERSAAIGSQIAAALAHAHAAGVVHRDVKPANVMVDPNERVKVTDFGIARAAGDSTLTATGVMLGTAHYISPEQASGSNVGPASDVYSLGIVMFEMLTGAVPFTGDSAVSVAMRHISDEVPAPSSIVPAIPPELDAVVEGATAKDPQERADAQSVGRALLAQVPTAGAVVELADPDATAVAPTTAVQPGPVWPIPGDRWDPHKVGRAVITTFLVLALIATSLLIWRLATKDDGSALAREGRQPAAEGTAAREPTPEPSTPETTPVNFVIPETLFGQKDKDVEKALEALGFIVEIVEYDTDEAEKGAVLGTDPEFGSEVAPGETITLFVSTGHSDDDDDDGPGNSDRAPGHDEDD